MMKHELMKEMKHRRTESEVSLCNKATLSMQLILNVSSSRNRSIDRLLSFKQSQRTSHYDTPTHHIIGYPSIQTKTRQQQYSFLEDLIHINVALLFMAQLETTLMGTLQRKGVCEWHQYVDDTFVLAQPDTDILDVLEVLDGFYPSIKFTYEVEQGQLTSILGRSSDPFSFVGFLYHDHLLEANVHRTYDQLAILRPLLTQEDDCSEYDSAGDISLLYIRTARSRVGGDQENMPPERLFAGFR
jgi:hypothetical protein